MEKEIFILKKDKMYLRDFYLKEEAIENEFISSIEFTLNEESSYSFNNYHQAEEMKKKIYLILGIEMEIKNYEKTI